MRIIALFVFYVLIFDFLVGYVRTEANTTSLASAGVQPQNINVENKRSGKCRQGEFDQIDGLMRYFECCRDGELSEAECIAECPCLPGGYCDHQTKTCRCHAGRTGEYCRNRCSLGSYGIECVDRCTCAEGIDCDDVSGLCSCPEEVSNCVKCMGGLYGPTCKIPCMCKDGGACDEDGNCETAAVIGSSSSSSYEVAVALGVILALLVLTACIVMLFCYLMKKQSNLKHRSATAYRGIDLSTTDIPFDVGIGRDSVDLVERPVQAPRNLSGLMRYLNTKQSKGLDTQMSKLSNRELPNIPEIDTSTTVFLAADGTQQPMADPEPISPTLTSAQSSFDVPCHTGDLAKSMASNTLPIPNQLNPPHIVIDEHTDEPQHGTPVPSPISSPPVVNSPYNLPQASPIIGRQYRSVSTPGITSPFYSSDNGTDYDQLDRSHRRPGFGSFASCPSSAGESGSENSYHTLRHHRRLKKNVSKGSVKKGSVKRRRFSFEKLKVKSRTTESDTESEDLSPRSRHHSHGSPESLSPLGSSEDLFSLTWPRLQLRNSLKDGRVDNPPTRQDFIAEGSGAYQVTTLPDCSLKNDARLEENADNCDYEAPKASPIYSKPKLRKNGGGRPVHHDYFVLNKFISGDSATDVRVPDSVTSIDETGIGVRTDDYEKPMQNLRKSSESIHSSSSSIDSVQQATLSRQNQRHQNRDNIQDSGSSSASDEREALIQKSRDDFQSAKNSHFRERVDDYETPMINAPQADALEKNQVGQGSRAGRDLHNNDTVTRTERPRVDDYETPMTGLIKPPLPKQ